MRAKTVYETSDGQQFEKKADAKAHEKFLKYEKAVDDLATKIASDSVKHEYILPKHKDTLQEFLTLVFKEQANDIALVLKNYHVNKPIEE
jgi:hypothetical protein